MAVKIDEMEDGGAPSETTIPTGTGKPTGNSGYAPLLTDVLTKLGRQSELGADGIKYIEQLAELMKKDLGNDVVVARIPDKLLDIYRVTYKDRTVMLTMSETYCVPSDTFIPPTDQIGPAAQTLKDTIGGHLLNNIVVTPNDYKEIAKMAAHLCAMFKLSTGLVGHITIDSLRKGQYYISTNINDVKDTIRRFNPKATMPRTDIGLVLYAKEEIMAGHGGQGIKQSTPILVIGGYTNFVSTAGAPNSYAIGSTAPSFLAITTITSILSPIMTKEMISLAIPLATEEFIRRNGWLRPYTKFGKKDPNLGSLIADSKGKPYFVDNINALMEFVSKNISKPYLAVDVTDGYARIPGLEGLRYGTDAVQRGVANFLGLSDTSGDLVFQRMFEYIGELQTGADTREVDYINLVANDVVDPNILLRFLYIPGEPHKRAELIAKLFEPRILYTNVRVVLNATYVDNLSNLVAQRFKPLWEQSATPENNLGNLGTGGNQFSIGPAFGMGSVGGGWSGVNYNPYG